MVLQVLYDNIKDKSKVMVNKRVQRVDMTDNGVTVLAQDGSIYKGDILVGADGIHSAVRGEMWRIADELSPGWISPKAGAGESGQSWSFFNILTLFADVPCDYGCVFGISQPCDGIEPGASNSVFRKHESYIINGGPGGRVYWFYFFKLPQRLYDDDIPKYTNEDMKRILDQRQDDNITPNLKFKTVLERRLTSVLVPLQEHTFKQWYFKRIITIGDSAHKVNMESPANVCVPTLTIQSAVSSHLWPRW